jgi:hypothetical protein
MWLLLNGKLLWDIYHHTILSEKGRLFDKRYPDVGYHALYQNDQYPPKPVPFEL